MNELTISVGESRHCTNWTPRTVSWERLCQKLSVPKRTEETAAEYAAMSKDQRAEAKDVGGFVGGRIEGGARKAGSITDRQIVCLDADFADMGLWDTYELMVDRACLMHTSHSHTPENPRMRLIIPLSRPVTAAEYEPIARRIAEWIDINAFDDTTYEASRLMYWPSCPKDGEFIVRINENPKWVDPDEILATYEDWHDMTKWPTSDRQVKAIVKMGAVQGDPLTKPGVIGAFNRAYTITEAIETYLSDVYSRCADDRWTFNGGTTTGGAVTYDNDTFIYSHHDTDPISRRLCSAFDMVRIHLFGEQDEDSEEEIGNLPSMSAMKSLLQNDRKVQKELADAVIANPADVFDEKTDLQRFTGDLTEQGLAVQLSDTYGANLRYNKSFGWMFWDGVRWVLDADSEANMLAMRFTDDMYQAARLRMQLAADKAEQQSAKQEFMIATKMRTASGVNHLMTLTKAIVNEPDTKSYDAEPWDLNTPDGIIDLKTGAIRNHDPRAKCTKCTNVSPGRTGVEQWIGFIDYITGGDKEFAEYLQTLAGMAAVGDVYEEGLVISYGPGGNGKSTFFGALKAAMGDYAKTINADIIINAYGKQTDNSYVAALRGARLVVLSETEESAVLSISQMKKITSQDVISARALYKDPIEFEPTHTTVMHTNHLPRLNSMDGGTKRRIAVAPFPATLSPEKVITNYQEVLVRECGPAILQWVIDGAIRFYTNQCKLPKPKCVEKATKEYLQNEDWFGNFLEECCELGEDYEEQASSLYSAYQVWAASNGLKPKRSRDFAVTLESHGFIKTRDRNCSSWHGLRLQNAM